MNKMLNATQFSIFTKLIEDYSGIHLEPERTDELSLALAQRANELNINFDKYLVLLEQSKAEEELKKIVGCITINETSFMRYPEQYSILQKIVMPEILNFQRKTEINILSAGCSSGEEPYSIAIALTEILPHYNIRILATDIDTLTINKARKAIYKPRTLRMLSEERLRNYFRQVGQDQYALKPVIKNKITFFQYNIASLKPPAGFTSFDIIFCRNVLIYFNKQTVSKIISSFYNMLTPKGYLFLGHSESLYSICTKFKAREVSNAYFYQKNDEENIEPIKNCSKEECGCQIDNTPVVKPEKPVEIDKFKKALELFKEKKHNEALREIEEIKEVNFHINLLKAQLLLEDGKKEEVKKISLDLLQQDSLSGYPYFILGLVALQENDQSQAIDNFRRAAYSLNGFALPHFYLANIYKQTGNNKRAISEYTKCVELLQKNPNDDIWKIFSPHFSPAAIVKNCRQLLADIS